MLPADPGPVALLRHCPVHGAFEVQEHRDEGTCPRCGHVGDALLDPDRRIQLSKFLSGALRHFPGDVGLSLDEHGWAPLADLVEAATSKYAWAKAPAVRAVLALDPKGRFETDEGRVRATYGHSVGVEVDAEQAGSIPTTLYHGTPARNVQAIQEEGLRPMSRREVHLSPDAETAEEVGRRHGDRVAIAVNTDELQEGGIDVTRRAETVYTCQRVPPENVDVVEEG